MCLAFFSLKYYLSFRSRYADCHLLFTNSFRGDLEAFLMGSVHRFGLSSQVNEFAFRLIQAFIRGIRFEENTPNINLAKNGKPLWVFSVQLILIHFSSQILQMNTKLEFSWVHLITQDTIGSVFVECICRKTKN